MTCLMTSLRPGQRPPQVTIAALTSSGLKYIFSRGPARWTLKSYDYTPSHYKGEVKLISNISEIKVYTHLC